MALFVASGGALVIEIVSGRMIAPYVGMSLYTWTAIIAVVLGGLSVGHWIGGHLAGGERERILLRLAVLLGLAAVTTAACLPLLRLLAPLALGSGLRPILGIIVLTAALFFLPSLFVGTVSPVLTKLSIDELPQAAGRAIGQMFAVGAVGSIFGTLAAGFFFISWIGTIGTVLAVAAAYLLAALCFLLAARPTRARTAGLLVALTAIAALIGGGGNRIQAFTSPCDVESDYYCIRVADASAETGRASALMVLDHLVHSINDRDDPTRLHTSYLDLADHLSQARFGDDGSFSAFFIGGGANTLPRAWSARFPEARLYIAEIDPAVTAAARESLWFETAPGIVIDHRDARVALSNLSEEGGFDVIVGDAFQDLSVPAHLTTLEFAQLLDSRLSERGLYLLNVADSARRPLFLYSVVRTLEQVFDAVEVWADADQLRGGGRITFLVAASRRPSGLTRLQSSSPEGPLWLRWPSEDLTREVRESGVPLLTDDFAPVVRLMLGVLEGS